MKLFVLVLFIVLAFFLLIRFIEKTSVFYPQKEFDFDPRQSGLPFEDVYVKTPSGLVLNGWLFRNPSAKATLLFFHGNAGNISHRMEKITLFYHLGLNVFIVDYRGYGKSQGIPSEHGIYEDALAAFDYLKSRQDLGAAQVIGYGESLGGVAAIDLSLNRPLDALIIDSSFSSAKDMARIYYPFVPAFLLTTKMDSAVKIKEVKVSKLFIHSMDDEIVPLAIGKKLFDAASNPKEFLEINGDHNAGYALSQEKYLSGIKSFLKKEELIP